MNKLVFSDDKTVFLAGETSYGHYQIELACDACHTDSFGGTEILQNACINCHGEELNLAHDSHPKKKFTDPREADRLKVIDARYCISCHQEHQRDTTHIMGLTLPKDYCYHCHQKVLDERESHNGLAFDSCASAGCHNYHDNRALYEAFLLEHANEPWLAEHYGVPLANQAKQSSNEALAIESSSFSQQISSHPNIAVHWENTAHAKGGVDCGGCHQHEGKWIERPDETHCKNCHAQEVSTFMQGKHGMRLAKEITLSLEKVSASDSHLEFSDKALHLKQGCNSCHSAHQFDTHYAAVEACLVCHADEHSLSFKQSPHGKTWQSMLDGDIKKEQSVSCSSCHMPRLQHTEKSDIYYVTHNQNDNLRPNEKMIRSVCMNCHSLEFSIDSLADKELIKNNFLGKPGTHIESIDWAEKRAKKDH